MLRASISWRALQQSANYRRLVQQLPANLILFDGMCPYVESNIHWVLTHNFTWPEGSDRIVHVCNINSPDAKYVLSHFPHTLYRVAERIDAGEPANTMVLLEKRPESKFMSRTQRNLVASERKRAEAMGEKAPAAEGSVKGGLSPQPKGSSILFEQPKFNVRVFVKSEAVFRIGQKLDDPMWRWFSTFLYWVIPRWLANEKYDKVAANRFDKYGKHTKLPKFSEEITVRWWKLTERPNNIR